MNQKELIKLWLTQNPKRTHRRAGKNLGFKDNTLFSYAVPIARILKSGEVIVDDRKWRNNNGAWSNTTQNHQRTAFKVASGEAWGWNSVTNQSTYTLANDKTFWVNDCAQDPSNIELEKFRERIRKNIEVFLAGRGGRGSNWALRKAAQYLERAERLSKHFNLDQCDYAMPALWERARRWEVVNEFGGVGKVRKVCRQYLLTDAVPIDKLAELLKFENELQRNIFAANLHVQYGKRGEKKNHENDPRNTPAPAAAVSGRS